MSIRITSTSEAERTVLRIAGRLMSEDCAELAGPYGAAECPHIIDLSDLQSADSEGVRLLLGFVRRGAKIRGASPYVELLLEMRQ
jgi:ABC-type transporter Mla MlaB component